MEVKNEKTKKKYEVDCKKRDLEMSRIELYELIKKYGIKDYSVLLKSREINDEINKEMRKQINVGVELEVFKDKNIIYMQSRNYSIIYKDYKIYTGIKLKNNKILWIKQDNKIFYSAKEAFNYLIEDLECKEDN